MRVLGYLDPGSGAMIGSAIAGIGAAVAVGVRANAQRFARIVSPKKRREAEAAAAAGATVGDTTEPELEATTPTEQ